MYGEDDFIAAIRAIEVFHRRAVGGVYKDKKEYTETYCKRLTARVEEIITTKDFRASLSKKLEYGYEYSLRRRLRELLRRSKYGDVFMELFIKQTEDKTKSKIREEFIERVVATRNWLTHFDDDDKELAVTDPKELKRLSLRLVMWLHIMLVKLHRYPSEQRRRSNSLPQWE